VAAGAAATGPTPAWLTDPGAARAAVIVMSLFQIGEGFVVAMATRQELPEELYDLAEVEGSGRASTFGRVTFPMMAPTLLLLLCRDTIFSLQASFVPALIVTEGGPPYYATTFLPVFVYRTGFEYLRYGYAAAATLSKFVLTALIVVVQYRIVKRWRSAFVV
jgi:multiple sugar transport system permease protein